MDTISLIITALLGLAMLYFITMMAVRIGNNVVTGKRYRDSLGTEVERLRLGRMLGVLGISVDRYTHQQSMVEIRQQMNACSNCPNTASCDDQLSKGYVDTDEMDYCDNADTLRELNKQEAQ